MNVPGVCHVGGTHRPQAAAAHRRLPERAGQGYGRVDRVGAGPLAVRGPARQRRQADAAERRGKRADGLSSAVSKIGAETAVAGREGVAPLRAITAHPGGGCARGRGARGEAQPACGGAERSGALIATSVVVVVQQPLAGRTETTANVVRFAPPE